MLSPPSITGVAAFASTFPIISVAAFGAPSTFSGRSSLAAMAGGATGAAFFVGGGMGGGVISGSAVVGGAEARGAVTGGALATLAWLDRPGSAVLRGSGICGQTTLAALGSSPNPFSTRMCWTTWLACSLVAPASSPPSAEGACRLAFSSCLWISPPARAQWKSVLISLSPNLQQQLGPQSWPLSSDRSIVEGDGVRSRRLRMFLWASCTVLD